MRARILVIIVLMLLSFGVVMLASSSSVKAESVYGDSFYFLKRQLAWLVVAAVAGLVAIHFDYRHWQRLAVPIGLFCVVLLILVLIPGIGREIGGSRRWLTLGPLRLQPSELAKFSSIALLAWWLTWARRWVDRFKQGLLIPLLMLGLITGLVFLEPDYGTSILVAAVGFSIMFVGGCRISYMVVTGVLALGGVSLAIMNNEERWGRVMAYLDPAQHQAQAYQGMQAADAFVAGGAFGVGVGQSIQKRFYLPEAHTDFIFAIVGEETGLPGTEAVLLLFAAFLVTGMVISFKAPDNFGRLLAFGLTLVISLQAAMNIGVVTGALPATGIPLPFISYGGSSLVMSCLCVGVLVNVARAPAAE